MKVLLNTLLATLMCMSFTQTAHAARYTPTALCAAIDNSAYESITTPISIGGDYPTGSTQSITVAVGDTEVPAGNQAATGDTENVIILLDSNNDGTPEVLSNTSCTYNQGATPPGCSTTQNITIPTVTEDTTFRGRVMLSYNDLNPTNSCGDNSYGDSEDFLIVADVSETIVFTDVSVPEDNGVITVTATLSHNIRNAGGFVNFTVDYATADGTATVADNDYIAASGTLNFNGQAGDTDTFTITPIADIIPEGDQTIIVNLSNLSNTTHGINISDTGVISLLEDDTEVALTMAKSVTDMAPNIGDTVVFTLQVNNAGPDAALNASVIDNVPAGFESIAPVLVPSGSSFVVSGNSINWNSINVPAGGSTIATFSAVVATP